MDLLNLKKSNVAFLSKGVASNLSTNAIRWFLATFTNFYTGVSLKSRINLGFIVTVFGAMMTSSLYHSCCLYCRKSN